MASVTVPVMAWLDWAEAATVDRTTERKKTEMRRSIRVLPELLVGWVELDR